MKCPKCGLMQGRGPRCKRCGNPFESQSAVPSPPRRQAKPLVADNPYAPPEVSAGTAIAGSAGEIFRDGSLIVARDGAPFPDRCVRCNQAAQGFRLKKTFYWHSPSWYALVLLNLLIYAIVAMVVRKKASFEVALCPQHRSRRKLFIGLAIGLPVLGLVAVMVTGGDVVAFWALLLAVLLGAVLGIVGSQVLTPQRIEDGYAYLKGAHPQFLASLPANR